MIERNEDRKKEPTRYLDKGSNIVGIGATVRQQIVIRKGPIDGSIRCLKKEQESA